MARHPAHQPGSQPIGSMQPGQHGILEYEGAGIERQIGFAPRLLAQMGNSLDIDELDVADRSGVDRRGADRQSRQVKPGIGTQIGLLLPLGQCRAGGRLDPIYGGADPAEGNQMVDPAQQLDHHQGDHHYGDEEQHGPAALPIGAGLEYYDAHYAEQEGPMKVDSTDRKSTRLNSSHVRISYAVFCLKKKTKR